jgi:hypothetical protein
MQDKDFLANKGLGNEVGIYVFHYPPEEAPLVEEHFRLLAQDKTAGFRLIERDLYEIFLKILEEKKILGSVGALEQKKGKDFLLAQLQKIATPDAFLAHMQYSPHTPGDILLLTGVGAVYPFMRSHIILNSMQHLFADIPVVMLYPGTFNGQDLDLFGKFLDGHYYRAFDLL